MWGLHDPYVKGGGARPQSSRGGAGTPAHWGRGQEAVCRLLVLDVVDPVARSGELTQLVRILRACLLMLSASPATAAMEICCVADYTVSHTDLAQNLFLLSRATQ